MALSTAAIMGIFGAAACVRGGGAGVVRGADCAATAEETKNANPAARVAERINVLVMITPQTGKNVSRMTAT